MYRLISNLEQKEIKRLYSENNTIKNIAIELKRDTYTISRWIDKLNLKKRPQSELQRKLHYNENYFNNIDTEIKSYMLGFIYADGCNTGRGLTISLNKKDRIILELLIQELESNLSIKEKKNNIDVLSIFNRQISSDLNKWGAVQQKCFKLNKLPNIAKELIPHFIRGYFDGDGCLSIYYTQKHPKYTFSITGNSLFIKTLNDLFVDTLNIPNNKLIFYKNSCRFISSKKQTIKLIGNYMYENCSFCLERKRSKFQMI